MDIVEKNLSRIIKECQSHQVDKMYVFGSVLSENFNDSSDIDFLVRFGDVDLYYYFDNLLDLKEKLEKLFNRPVDILEEQAVSNPYLKKSINKNKVLIYG